MAVAAVKKFKRAPVSPAGNRYRGGNKSRPSSRRFPNLLPWLLTIITGVVVMGAVSIALLFMYRFFTTSNFFALKEVQVSGNNRFVYSDILQTAELTAGMNSLAVSISDVERKLLTNPWVNIVSVKRKLPDSFHIAIAEREPRYWLLRNGKLVYADSLGQPIDAVGPVKFTSLPVLTVESGAETLLGRLPELLTRLEHAQLPVNAGAASWVRVSRSRGVEMYLESSDLVIAIDEADWSGNVRRLGLVLADLSRRGELKRARDIEVQGENVWVRTEPAA